MNTDEHGFETAVDLAEGDVVGAGRDGVFSRGLHAGQSGAAGVANRRLCHLRGGTRRRRGHRGEKVKYTTPDFI